MICQDLLSQITKLQMVDKSIHQFLPLPFETVYFQNFCKKYCRKTLEVTIMKKVSNESKLILIHSKSIFTIYCLLFSYTNSFNSKEKFKMLFFQQSILKFTFTLTHRDAFKGFCKKRRPRSGSYCKSCLIRVYSFCLWKYDIVDSDK